MTKVKKAVILLSGGLDSATVAAIAKDSYELYAISFLYGQRHNIELQFAKNLVSFFNIKEHKIVTIDLTIFGNSALTDKSINVPKNRHNISDHNKIPITYVPARNTIFLSYALAYAEIIQSCDIFIGANSIDYSGYPDCRGEFINAFETMSNFATSSKNQYKIHAPLLKLNKEEIINLGIELGIDYSLTHSCYDPVTKNDVIYACGNCDSCILRLDGFKKNNIKDPYQYLL